MTIVNIRVHVRKVENGFIVETAAEQLGVMGKEYVASLFKDIEPLVQKYVKDLLAEYLAKIHSF